MIFTVVKVFVESSFQAVVGLDKVTEESMCILVAALGLLAPECLGNCVDGHCTH